MVFSYLLVFRCLEAAGGRSLKSPQAWQEVRMVVTEMDLKSFLQVTFEQIWRRYFIFK